MPESQATINPERLDEAQVLAILLTLPDLWREAARNAPLDRFVDAECFVGTPGSGVHLSIRSGEIVAAAAGPTLMRSWRFAYRATPEAWAQHWRAMPKAGWHDLLSLTKSGAATLEGDMHPFLSNLQFFKDLLALPRGRAAALAGGAA